MAMKWENLADPKSFLMIDANQDRAKEVHANLERRVVDLLLDKFIGLELGDTRDLVKLKEEYL